MPVTGWPNHFCAAGCTASASQRSSAEKIGQASVAGGETDAVVAASGEPRYGDIGTGWPPPG